VAEGLGGLLGGSSVITQLFLWSAMSPVLIALLGPYMESITTRVNTANPVFPPTPPELAEMVVKNILQEAAAAAEAAKSGENTEHFHRRVMNTGEPPGLEQVLQWWRRGFIPWSSEPGTPSVENALRTSRIYDYWIETIQQAQFAPLTVADAINAWVRNQVDEATALKYAYQNGIKEEEARILYHTVGRPPGPMEALEMVRRGIIPMHGKGPDALSFDQAVDEGDVKDKWAAPLAGLLEHIPGIFEIRRAQEGGGITAEQAAHYYALLGLPQDLAQGLVTAASGTKTVKHRELALSVVESLYRDGFITAADFDRFLGLLGYDQGEAEYIRDVVDYQLVAESERAAITKTRAAFLAHHIDATQTREVLDALGVPAERAQRLLTLWEDERGATIRVLTEGEIVAAVFYGVATVEWGLSRLQAIGYSAADAWVLISNRMRGRAPNPPPDAPPEPPPTTPTTARRTTTGG
jgi:hypothetical protein